MTDAFQQLLTRAQRRLWLGRMLRLLERGLVISAVLAGALVVVHVWLLSVPRWLSLCLLGAPILAALLRGLLFARPSRPRTAAELDRRLDASELLVTACDVASGGKAARSANAELVRQQAALFCARADGATLGDLCRLPSSMLLLVASLAGLGIPLGQGYGNAAGHTPGGATAPPTSSGMSASSAATLASAAFRNSVTRADPTGVEPTGTSAETTASPGGRAPATVEPRTPGAPAGADELTMRPGAGGDLAAGDGGNTTATSGSTIPVSPAAGDEAWAHVTRRTATSATGTLTAAAPLVAAPARAAEVTAPAAARPARLAGGRGSLQRSFALEAWLRNHPAEHADD